MLALFELCGKIDRFDVGDARKFFHRFLLEWRNRGGDKSVVMDPLGSLLWDSHLFRSFLAMLLTVGTMRADYRKFGRTGPSDKLVWSRGCPREARRLPAWTTWIARTVRQGSKL